METTGREPLRAEVSRQGNGTGGDGGFTALVRSGDRERACAVLLRVTGALRGHLVARYGHRVGGADGVEDLVHRAVLRALASADRFDPRRGDLAAWLRGIGACLARDEVRRRETRRRHESIASSHRESRSDPAADERRETVRECIDALCDTRHRKVLLTDLAYGGRAPSGVLARVLGVRPSTALNVRWRAHRAVAPALAAALL